ncbi:hypothetical protein B566_EDAN001033 [Ephemera danica]|nr:hypothetical protein B566_EDAN001033 [Ephemera danica]
MSEALIFYFVCSCSHVLTHTERRPYVCKECSKRFSIKSHLLRHMRNHKDNRPFKCRYCEFTCKTLENLRKHILKTKKHPGKLIYHCKLCKTEPVFATNDGNEFRSHLHGAHKQNLKTMKIGTKNILPYALDICENFLEISRKEKSQLQGETYPLPKIVSQSKVVKAKNTTKHPKNAKKDRKPLKKLTASLRSAVQQNNDRLRRNYEELYHFLRPKLNVPLEEIEFNSTELNSETPIVSVDVCSDVTDECLICPSENGSQPGPLSVPLVETSPETQLLLLQDAGMSSCLVVCEVTNEPQNFMFPVLNDQYLYATPVDSQSATTSDLQQYMTPAYQDDVDMKVVVTSVEDDFSLPVAFQSLPDI